LAWRRPFLVWLERRNPTGFWEADHIVPVIEGGGLAPPEGYRILCIPCHRAETAALAARRAAARRPKRTRTDHQTTLLEI
jgi:5-methylcytosine-specific restriction endonuclease McrA